MPIGIEVDADMGLGLKVGERGSARLRKGACRFQVVHLKFQMHHHLLVARFGGPDRSDVDIFDVK